MTVNAVAVRELVSALRSGRYKQGTRSLKYRAYDSNENQFCCEGVGCELFGDGVGLVVGSSDSSWKERVEFSFNTATGLAPGVVANYLGIEVSGDGTGWRVGIPESPLDSQGCSCGCYNDDRHVYLAPLNDSGFSFDQIADLIEWYYLNGGNGNPV